MLKNKEFGEEVRKQVQERLGEDCEVQITEISKNNGTVMTGLSIFGKGTQVTPVIYLEDIEERFGIDDMEHAVDVIEKAYGQEKEREGQICEIPSLFKDKGGLLGKIYPKVVNAGKNADLLEGAPHKRLLDLAVIYYCKLEMQGGIGSITIKNEHMEMTGITEEELEAAAFENLRKAGSESMRLGDMLAALTGENYEGEQEVPMMILTNREKVQGAAEMLIPEVMDSICDKFKSDAYVLPSSVHEVILVPATALCELGYLRSMVKEVNATQVREDEVLSDSVYIYRRSDRHLAIA